MYSAYRVRYGEALMRRALCALVRPDHTCVGKGTEIFARICRVSCDWRTDRIKDMSCMQELGEICSKKRELRE